MLTDNDITDGEMPLELGMDVHLRLGMNAHSRLGINVHLGMDAHL